MYGIYSLRKWDNDYIYNIINQHHERIDGSGYPNGLKGDEIMEEAKIIAICDSYDAMVSNRIYDKAKTKQEALNEIEDLSGTLYDTELVDVFIKLQEKCNN